MAAEVPDIGEYPVHGMEMAFRAPDGIPNAQDDGEEVTVERILVTGGAGFIGSHLCERLLARGDEVLCVDNFFTSRRQNISHLFGHPSFEFMRHDITWPLYVEVDRIYNLACPASPVHYLIDPTQPMQTNV